MRRDDPNTMKRAAELSRMMNDYLRNMTPQERDRRMQTHLAQARGPAGNGKALRLLMNTFIRAHYAQRAQELLREARTDGGST